MRAVEHGQHAIQLETDPGTPAFTFLRPAGYEQVFNIFPQDCRADGIGEYGGQYLAVFPVHGFI
jgi:hypothetical protein